MTPSFVPLIGSSFDSLGQQGLAWAGFSQRVDEDNLRRAQQAQEAQNQWFSRLAEMQGQENVRRDAADTSVAEIARRGRADAMNLALGQQQTESAKAQFERQQALREKEFKWQQDTQDKERERVMNTTADYAEHTQPLLNETGQNLDAAQKEMNDAIKAITSKSSRAERVPGFPIGKVGLKGGQYEVLNDPTFKKPYELSPTEVDAVRSANDMLANDNAKWLLAQEKLKLHTEQWKLLHGEIGKYGLMPIKQGSGWVLHDPSTGKTFGKVAEEPPAEEPPAGPPIWEPEQGTLGATMKTWAPMPAELAPTTGSTGGWAGFGGDQVAPQITKRWRLGPDGKVMLVQ